MSPRAKACLPAVASNAPARRATKSARSFRGTQIEQRLVRFLEVITKDAFDGRGWELQNLAFEPVNERLVQIRPHGLRDAEVRGVAYENVREPESVLLT